MLINISVTTNAAPQNSLHANIFILFSLIKQIFSSCSIFVITVMSKKPFYFELCTLFLNLSKNMKCPRASYQNRILLCLLLSKGKKKEVVVNICFFVSMLLEGDLIFSNSFCNNFGMLLLYSSKLRTHRMANILL